MGGKLLIGIDCDEPLADLNTFLQAWHNKTYGTDFSREDIYTFKLWKIWGCSQDESNRRVLEFYESPDFDRITPTEGSIDGVAALAKDNELVVPTSRIAGAIPKTEPFINRHYPGKFSEIIFSKHCVLVEGKSKTKAEICIEKRIDLLVEDCLQYALECQENGIPVILFDRPWNRRRELRAEGLETLPQGIVRAVGWPEVVPLVSLFKENREKFYEIQKYKDLIA